MCMIPGQLGPGDKISEGRGGFWAHTDPTVLIRHEAGRAHVQAWMIRGLVVFTVLVLLPVSHYSPVEYTSCSSGNYAYSSDLVTKGSVIFCMALPSGPELKGHGAST